MDKSKQIHTFYTYLKSQQTAQEYLLHQYQKLGVENAEALSYENCQTFVYYLNHGLEMYADSKQVGTTIKPVLYFYGMIHLIKACVIAKRPNYPESTTMLAHGVSTRKRKKKVYTFLDDEVKIQQNGLFPYFSEHLFQFKTNSLDKVQMDGLFATIPEMATLYQFHGKETIQAVGTIGANELKFPAQILDNYQITLNAFIRKLEAYIPDIAAVHSSSKVIEIKLTSPILSVTGAFLSNSLSANKPIYYPMHKNPLNQIPEVMIHYLLLYNLSMLSRYETAWWGDLLATKPDQDYPFISHFLEITAWKIPLLLGEYLYDATINMEL